MDFSTRHGTDNLILYSHILFVFLSLPLYSCLMSADTGAQHFMIFTSFVQNIEIVLLGLDYALFFHSCCHVIIFLIAMEKPLVKRDPDILCQGPVSLKVFPSQLKKIDGNFVSLSPRFKYSDCYGILYMVRQMCCRGMCKYLFRSDDQQRNYSKAKFPSNLNYGQKIVSEMGPCCSIFIQSVLPVYHMSYDLCNSWQYNYFHSHCHCHCYP